MADPNLWAPFPDGTSLGQWADEARTQAGLKALGVSDADIKGYWAYEEVFDDHARAAAHGRPRTARSARRPPATTSRS